MMDVCSGEEGFSLNNEEQQEDVEVELSMMMSSSGWEVERVHMFDKVVTPSDVGKLNRLVIPKQHAEKYFPLDSSNNKGNGVFLNFLDRHGKSWRFRYSYWNSSQSYVITKGWSRFVKDNNLFAGDLVSFLRHKLHPSFFIDSHSRPHHHLHLPSDHHRYSSTWTPLLLPLHPQFTDYNLGGGGSYHHPHHHHHHHHLHQEESSSSNNNNNNNMVPAVVQAAGKKLRLFGVNMEMNHDDYSSSSNHHPNNVNDKGKSMSLDFHI